MTPRLVWLLDSSNAVRVWDVVQFTFLKEFIIDKGAVLHVAGIGTQPVLPPSRHLNVCRSELAFRFACVCVCPCVCVCVATAVFLRGGILSSCLRASRVSHASAPRGPRVGVLFARPDDLQCGKRKRT